MNLRAYLNLGRAFVCGMIVLTILTARIGFAQQTTTKEWAFGYEAFNLLLQESDIKICGFNEWKNTPDEDKFVLSIDGDGVAHFDWSPIMADVPSLVMSSNGPSLDVSFRPLTEFVASNQSQDFYETEDCPIVRPRSKQDVFFGVLEIVCNTPGYIYQSSVEQPTDEQFYPPTVRLSRRGGGRERGPVQRRFSLMSAEPMRRIWVADPMLFTNQMIFKADNLRFADNTVRWLSNDYRRKKVLLLIAGLPQSPVDPSDLDILTPIPTHSEVIEAVSKLPTSEIAKFANSVVQISEDENIFNDLAHKYTDGLKDGQVNRLLLFVIFACCCTIGLISYFWQRRVSRRTASVTASRRQRNLSKRGNESGASERQAAASMLLNSFCLEVANRRLADWPEFPTPIVSQYETDSAAKATNEMADAFWRLRTKPKSYWTKDTLMKLEQTTNHWRQLLLQNRITIEAGAG